MDINQQFAKLINDDVNSICKSQKRPKSDNHHKNLNFFTTFNSAVFMQRVLILGDSPLEQRFPNWSSDHKGLRGTWR